MVCDGVSQTGYVYLVIFLCCCHELHEVIMYFDVQCCPVIFYAKMPQVVAIYDFTGVFHTCLGELYPIEYLLIS